MTDTDTGADPLRQLEAFIDRHRRLFVLTGAGCSTASGIPDYRDGAGQWKRAQPTGYAAFMGNLATRQRYWARNMLGWRFLSGLRPNDAHHALARLEQRGGVQVLLTQNVDRLHQAAGSRNVIDLHGRIDVVRCMACDRTSPRAALQPRLEVANPRWQALQAAPAPDGDADLEAQDFSDFAVPPCEICGGLLKPDVVFFGESVPQPRVEAAWAHLAQADALLVVGSSLMVRSGYRFVEAAARAGLPLAAVNLGRTRADALLALKVARPCAEALGFLLAPAG